MTTRHFDYREVPYEFSHCFNHSCPRAAECLRHVAATYATNEVYFIKVVNPAAYPINPAKCPFFLHSERIRLAWGFSKLYDHIPYATAVKIRQAMRLQFARSTYYRMQNQERPVSPSEQETIAHIFAKNGITAPPEFDRYTYAYNWQP